MLILCEHFYVCGLTHCPLILPIDHLKLEDLCSQPQDNSGRFLMLTATLQCRKCRALEDSRVGHPALQKLFLSRIGYHYPVQASLDLWSSCLSFPCTGITSMYHHTQLSCPPLLLPPPSVYVAQVGKLQVCFPQS